MKNWWIASVVLRLAIATVPLLIVQSAWAQEKQLERNQISINAVDLLVQQPNNNAIVQISEVKINPTDTGVEIILVTTEGENLQITTNSEGNSYIVEIPNAQLNSPDGQPFRAQKPIEGINEIVVANQNPNTIRLTVTGETEIPTLELFDSEEGLIFSASSSVASTPPPTTSPPFPRGEQGGSQEESQEGQIIPVTGVQLNPTDTGLELILQTPPNTAELLQPNNVSEGNRFVADIPNAQLQLPDNQPFRAENPLEGISEVTVTNSDASTIRVTATGETTIPQVELFDSNAELIFGLTPVEESAQTPTEEEIVSIDRVQVNPTETGFEIILLTPTGVAQQLRVINVSQGNNFIADIPNAQLQKPFRQENPIEGVSEIAVTNQDESTVRVTVIGEEQQPTVELFDSEEGLIFSAQTEGENDIELVVTGEQETGYRVPDASTATRTNTPIRDIPQSIQVVPRQVIEDQQVTRISDAARNVSSVNIRAGFGGANDDYNIRGFDSFERLRNGFFAPAGDVNPNDIERVEVLKGPASVLYGQFEPGGVINFVTKQPLEEPYYSGEFTIGNYDFYKPSFDISGPLTSDRDLFYRLNVAYENSGSFIDFVDREVLQISPIVSYKIGDSTDISFAYEYLNHDGTWYDGLPIDPIAFDLPRSRFTGEPDDSFNRESQYFNLALEHRFSDNWKLRSGFALQFNNLESASFRNNGVEPDGRTLNRFFQNNVFLRNDAYSIQNDIIGEFKTGPIEHQLLFGFEYQRYTFDNYALYATADPIDLFDPVYGASVPTSFDFGPNRFTSRRETVGLYVQDLISFLPNLKLLIGGRYDFIDEKSINQNFDLDGRTLLEEPTTESFYNEAFSPRIGIVYQPIEPISLYASYSRSFVPNNARTIEGELIEPTRGTQYEVGVKTEVLDGRLAATLAAYEITKTNVLTVDPENPDFSIPVGEVRSRGIEFDIAGEPLPGWNIIASFFVNETEVTVGDEFSPEGDILINAPGEGASLWTTYEIQEGDLQGLGFGIGLFYIGDRQAELPNTFRIPSYVRTDAAIFYRRDNWRVGLNFRNLFDTTYYNYQGNGLQVGDPFTVLGTISVQF